MAAVSVLPTTYLLGNKRPPVKLMITVVSPTKCSRVSELLRKSRPASTGTVCCVMHGTKALDIVCILAKNTPVYQQLLGYTTSDDTSAAHVLNSDHAH